MDTAAWILVWALVVLVVAVVAHYIVTKFFAPALHEPLLLIIGSLLLISLLVAVLGWPPWRPRALA